ncbi:RNase A-like domain-containing protein [Hyphomicrobium sp. MC8b]|uniref:RNase A-like domain-containing protein n=1 Tax=Hyphomicrobium sp. MC8b TaxID=300273 RepID=UPI00391A345A
MDILQEDAVGGHTYAEHVGKPEGYLKARITGSRPSVPYIFGVGEKRAGSFSSLEAANKLVNSTMADPENAAKIDMFREGKYRFLLPELRIFKTFSSPTGIEAYAPDDRTPPIMRTTSGVTVRLIRTGRVPRGYYVDSAWPMNED